MRVRKEMELPACLVVADVTRDSRRTLGWQEACTASSAWTSTPLGDLAAYDSWCIEAVERGGRFVWG